MNDYRWGILTGLSIALALFSFAHIVGWVQ